MEELKMDKYTAIKEAISIVSPDYEGIIHRYTKNANKYGKKELSTSGHTFLQSISKKKV